MTNSGHGIPCKDCTAHSGIVSDTGSSYQELGCLRHRFEEYEAAREDAHGKLHERINEVVKSKTSVKLFMWVVGGILTSMIVVSGFLWNSVKASEVANQTIHKETSEQMFDISADIRVIKSELKNK